MKNLIKNGCTMFFMLVFFQAAYALENPNTVLDQQGEKYIIDPPNERQEAGLTLNITKRCLTCPPPENERAAKRKKGFILGFGIGASYLTTKARFDGESEKLDGETAFFTDFIIGAGISDQFLLYFSSKVHWYSVEEVIITSGQGSVGVSYFLKDTPKSPFVSAGIGYAALDAPFEDGDDGELGFGLFVGGGYEFANHFFVQGNIAFNTFDLGDGFRVNRFAFGVSVNYLLY